MDDGGTDSDGGSDDGGDDSTSTDGGSTGTDGGDQGSTDDGGDDDDPIFDVGAGDEGGNNSGEGCKKVDFLFIIDNSASMTDKQDALVASFPGFIDEIKNTVAATDYHIMVVDTDTYPNCEMGSYGMCNEYCSQPCPFGCRCVCDGNSCLDSCSETLGAGRRHDEFGMECGVAGNARYMTQQQPDLEGTFACVAKAGSQGQGNEKPTEAMELSVTQMQKPGQCNEGFLRDDAILVVTVITDAPNGPWPGDPGTWKQTIVDAKSGDETAVVALALVRDGDLPNPVCQNGGDTKVLRNWAESFTHGSSGSVCEPDYTPFFHDAVSVIDLACEQFEPPG